jgi:hypothetical protein
VGAGVKPVVAAPAPHRYRLRFTMSDRFFYPLAALIALIMLALALVWPQGTGVRSPAPFGHAVAPPPRPDSPELKAAKARAAALKARADRSLAP